jgi:hypothetical protein
MTDNGSFGCNLSNAVANMVSKAQRTCFLTKRHINPAITVAYTVIAGYLNPVAWAIKC